MKQTHTLADRAQAQHCILRSLHCAQGQSRCTVNIGGMNGWRSSQGSREWHDGEARAEKVLREHLPEEVELNWVLKDEQELGRQSGEGIACRQKSLCKL